MGATAITVTPSNWTKLKPDSYKDKGLENALKVLEAAKGKEVGLKDEGMAALQARLDSLKPIAQALTAAIAAANKAVTDINKLAKAEKEENAQAQLSNASACASTIAGQLGKVLKAIS